MNPGPWGMAHADVSFGTVCAVRDRMHITCGLERQRNEHPKRPVPGLDEECDDRELSRQNIHGFRNKLRDFPQFDFSLAGMVFEHAQYLESR